MVAAAATHVARAALRLNAAAALPQLNTTTTTACKKILYRG